jgi:hypothetical protein
MNPSHLKKFRATIGNFKLATTIERPSAKPNPAEAFSFMFAHSPFKRIPHMIVAISGRIGRAPQPLPDRADGLPVVEAALAVAYSDGKDWYAIQFFGDAWVRSAQQVQKNSTIAVAGELTFEPLPDTDGFKPVVAVSDLQLFP